MDGLDATILLVMFFIACGVIVAGAVGIYLGVALLQGKAKVLRGDDDKRKRKSPRRRREDRRERGRGRSRVHVFE